MKENLLIIAKQIKDLRQSFNWSQSELARRSGVTRAAINKIEKGHASPSFTLCQKIAKALKVEMGDLVQDNLSNELLRDLNIDDKKIVLSLIRHLKRSKSSTSNSPSVE